MDSASADWVRTLSEGGRERERAAERLHQLLLRAAQAEVRRRSGLLGISGPELDDLAHQAAADAVVSVLAKVAEFRGESRFTTWAYRFVVLEVSSKIGRHFWRRPHVPLDAGQWERLPDRLGLDPSRQSEQRELMDALRRAVQDDLTDRQRTVFTALVVDGVPLDALVVRLESSWNALYKTMFDARRKLRASLVAGGYLPETPRGSR
ncbi:sigma-70 family RNA polymerase sigma factor [Streptacidiphilus sp. NEAU-YB345]|uniref:Sigma-70 family RNA polymerase sigma factor n=1 Tax=Streptacidiphilus fuscans TaxID=2789292 RepID=A0A931B812_9ACTN|nr:sigma-70 family RNA polymerase sigma factor [Streptacidiphilus fuscans]